MASTLAQTGAIIRTELLMSWRRRALPVLGGFFLFALIGFSLLQPDSQAMQGIAYVNDRVSPPQVTRFLPDGTTVTEDASAELLAAVPPPMRNVQLDVISTTLTVISLSALIFPVLAAITVTVMLAETIPLDRHYRVRELLRALPLGEGPYIGGKLLGGLIAVMLVMTLVMLAYGLFARLYYGPYDLNFYLRAWLLLVLPYTMACAGWSILTASVAGSRRVAVIIGLVLIPFAVLIYAYIFAQLWTNILTMGQRGGFSTETSLDMLLLQSLNNFGGLSLTLLASVAVLFVVVWALRRQRA